MDDVMVAETVGCRDQLLSHSVPQQVQLAQSLTLALHSLVTGRVLLKGIKPRARTSSRTEETWGIWPKEDHRRRMS